MSQFLPPEGTPPPADEPEAFNAKAAGNALIQWANAQKLKPDELKAAMSKVMAKIIVDHTRKDALDLNEALDRTCLQLANDINSKLFDTRQDIRLQFRRKP